MKVKNLSIVHHIYTMMNLILNNIKVCNKNKNIWIFGAWGGEKYADNSKYLFEYVLKNCNHIRPIWITKNNQVYSKLRLEDKEVYKSNSLKGIYFKLISGVVFYTHTPMDFGNIDLTKGSLRICLWHGIPLKKIGLDLQSGNYIKKKLRKYKWEKYIAGDYCISNNDETKEIIAKAFGQDIKNVICSGQPRNDLLINKEIDIEKLRRNFLNKLSVKNDFRIITYMPTFRNNLENLSKFEKVINEFVNSDKLNNILIENNYYIFIKMHPKMKIGKIKCENMKVVNDEEIDDVQELLLISDILITDYSSCFIDFALTNRPILFLATDVQEYCKYENSFYYRYTEITKHTYNDNFNDFVNELELCINDKPKYIEITKKINKKFNNDKFCFSKNIVEEIYNFL